MVPILAVLLWTLAVLLLPTTAIPTISITGSKFFTSEGQQWFIKGIAYQLIEDDPLANTEQCQRDADLMKQLGANAIRVYHVNAAADHSGCMNAFAAAGIYAFIDLDSFKTYIRYDTTSSWTQNKSDSYRAIMDNFQQYDNVAGWLVGNEVLNGMVDASAAPYILSAAADLKLYSQRKGYRKIPIGYSATDTTVLSPMLQDYLVCRPNMTERLDYYALNSYRWCGEAATYQTSGYQTLTDMFQNYPAPVFFSEVGCNTVPPRTFNDQAAIFGPEMSGIWSGSIIYEWIQEMNQYGLVSYGPQLAADVNDGNSIIQGFTREGAPTPISPDFTNLKAQWAAATPSSVDSAQYAASLKMTSGSCPASTATGWPIDPTSPLPTLGAEGVTSGMPGGVPTGSITAMVNTNITSPTSGNPTASTSRTYVSTGSSTMTGESASSPSKGAAGKSSTPLFIGDSGIGGMVVALIAVGAGAMLLL